jgi:hypothetical protein
LATIHGSRILGEIMTQGVCESGKSHLQHASAWVKKVMDSGAWASHAGGKIGNVGRYWFPVRDFDAE